MRFSDEKEEKEQDRNRMIGFVLKVATCTKVSYLQLKFCFESTKLPSRLCRAGMGGRGGVRLGQGWVKVGRLMVKMLMSRIR